MALLLLLATAVTTVVGVQLAINNVLQSSTLELSVTSGGGRVGGAGGRVGVGLVLSFLARFSHKPRPHLILPVGCTVVALSFVVALVDGQVLDAQALFAEAPFFAVFFLVVGNLQ